MALTSPNLGYSLIAEGQSGAHIKFNEHVVLTDIFHGGIDGLTLLTAPPGSPANADVYLVDSPATGTWTGEEGKVAIYHDGAWRFFAMPSIWSTTEQATQLYRDGAQVYTKVISATPPTTADIAPYVGTYVDVTAHGITGLDLTKPLKISAFWHETAGGSRYYGTGIVVPTSATTILTGAIVVDASYIAVRSNFAMGTFTITIKLEYSKT